MRRLSLVLAVLLLAGLACGGPSPAPRATATTPPVTAPLPSHGAQAPRPTFTLATEYAVLGLAKAYAATGLTYAKPQLTFGIWGNLEPKPGEYHWELLDALVGEYQAAGFTGLQLLLTAESPWASIRVPKPPLDPGDTFPKEEYLDDYAAFVTRVVERYDADGVDDMPGLKYPIHDYGIEREFTGYWPGTADEYMRLLRIAYPEIHTADPQARVLLNAILMVDVFDGAPDAAELQRRLAHDEPGIRKSVPDILTVLSACDAYDILDFHSLGDYTEIPPTTAWLREQLAAKGCAKPIWIGDSFAMSALVGYNARPARPATAETRDRVIATLKVMADPANPGHAAVNTWLQGEVARGLVKKAVVAAGEGILGINLGNQEDWLTPVTAINVLSVPMLGTSMFLGMMDTTRADHALAPWPYTTGNDWNRRRRPGDARPAFYALELANAKLAYVTRPQKLDLGLGVWAYRFETPGGPLWALWYDDGKLYFPGETPPATTLQLRVDGARVLVTRSPARPGETGPETRTLAAPGDALTLTLDSTPVFVQLVS